MAYNFNTNTPIYMQLLDDIKLNIISGKLKPNDKLPSVRDFAFEYKVNPNTMQKALQELEQEGLIYTERTNGKYVTENPKIIKKIKNEYINKITNEYLEKMNNIGLTQKEIKEYLNRKEEN